MSPLDRSFLRVMFWVCLFVAVLMFLKYSQQDRRTEDQKYGCTVEQQAPNGDCP